VKLISPVSMSVKTLFQENSRHLATAGSILTGVRNFILSMKISAEFLADGKPAVLTKTKEKDA